MGGEPVHPSDLKTAGFDGKYGVFPEPTITSATTSYAWNTITRGVDPEGPTATGSGASRHKKQTAR